MPDSLPDVQKPEAPAETPVHSPPPTPRPPDEPDATRLAADRLASALSRTRNTRFLVEYLRLRRVLRTA